MQNQYRLLFGSTYFALGALYSLLSLYLQDIGFSGTQIGTISAAGSLVLIFSQPIWGIIADKTRRTIFLLKISLVAAGILALGLMGISTYWPFLLLYALVHFFQGANGPIANTLGIEAARTLQINFGTLRQYGAIGFALAVFLVSRLSEAVGIWIIFPSYAAAYFIAAAFFRQQEVGYLGVPVERLPHIREQLALPRFRLIMLSSFFIIGPIMANNNYYSLLFDHVGGTVAGIGLAFLLFAGSEAPFMKASGHITRRFSLEKTMMLAAGISALRWFWYSLGPPPSLMIALFILQGISVGLFVVVSAEYVAANSLPRLKNTAMTLYASAAIGLGGITCQLAGGILYDAYDILAVYRFFAWSTLAGILFLVMLQYGPDKEIRKNE